MINIAIVEDNEESAKKLFVFLERYGKEFSTPMQIKTYKNGVFFLEEKTAFDIVFMDIEMPYLSGIETAKKLRERGSECCIIFVTNLKQYALEGYSVHAYDYILKPITYESFFLKIHKAITLAQKKKEFSFTVRTKGGVLLFDVASIYYIEVVRHKLFYYTQSGVYETWGNMSETEEKLKDHGFSRCNVCYLVNLKYVKAVKDDGVQVEDTVLKISSSRKKAFLKDLMFYVRGL